MGTVHGKLSVPAGRMRTSCICWGYAASDHNTIARFRSRHLSEAVEDLLYQMVRILVQRLKKLHKRLYVKAEYEYESLVVLNSV